MVGRGVGGGCWGWEIKWVSRDKSTRKPQVSIKSPNGVIAKKLKKSREIVLNGGTGVWGGEVGGW